MNASPQSTQVGAHAAAPTTMTRPSAAASARRRDIRNFLEALLYLAPSLLIFVTFVFVPLVRTFWLSGYATDPLGRPSVFVGLAEYQRLIETPDFANSLMTSLEFVLLTVPTTIVVGLILATLGNLRLRSITVFRAIISSTIAVSAATASLIFLYLYNQATGPFNYFLDLLRLPPVQWLTSSGWALVAVSMTSVWLSLGLNTIIMLAGMQGISDEYYESAKIDGAGFWSSFRNITLPLLSPTLFFLLVVDTLGALQAFTQIQIMTKGGPIDSTNVIVYSIYREFYFNGDYGFAAAQAVILFFIMLILTSIQFGVIERRVFYQ